MSPDADARKRPSDKRSAIFSTCLSAIADPAFHFDNGEFLEIDALTLIDGPLSMLARPNAIDYGW